MQNCYQKLGVFKLLDSSNEAYQIMLLNQPLIYRITEAYFVGCCQKENIHKYKNSNFFSLSNRKLECGKALRHMLNLYPRPMHICSEASLTE